jgi:WD40 repeat protein
MTHRYLLALPLIVLTWAAAPLAAVEPKLEATLTGHTDVVYAIAFSPDQKWLASGSQDQTIKLWDVAAAKETQSLAGHSSWVAGVAFLPPEPGAANSAGLVSLGATGELKRWDLASGKESPIVFAGHRQLGFTMALSRDGKQLATGGIDLVTSTIKLWNPVTGMLTRTLEGHSNFVSGLSFTTSGKLLASSSQDRTIKIWDVATGKEVTTLAGHDDRATGVAFAPDEKSIASIGFDGSVKLWDVATGKERLALAGHNLNATSLAFHPDGSQLATGSTAVAAIQGEVKLWDVATGKELATIQGQTGTVFSLAYSADGSLLAVASGDHKVRLWQLGGK